MSDRARSFETAAAEYERYRPGYPRDAIAWVAERLGLAPGARVLDIGAGTGKLSRGLLGAGFDVVAVEPGAAMLAELRAALPDVEAHIGSAEAIPLPDASVDAAAAGQAFHWFYPARAVPELHRVVRPGGGVALLWNWWDHRDALQQRLTELLGRSGEPDESHLALTAEGAFAEAGHTIVDWALETTPAAVAARLATTSGLLVETPERRADLLAEIRRIAGERGERLVLPQRTLAYAYRRVS